MVSLYLCGMWVKGGGRGRRDGEGGGGGGGAGGEAEWWYEGEIGETGRGESKREVCLGCILVLHDGTDQHLYTCGCADCPREVCRL